MAFGIKARLAQSAERKALNLVVVGPSPLESVDFSVRSLVESSMHGGVLDGGKMVTLGFEPRAFCMRSGCDTTTSCALCGVQGVEWSLDMSKAPPQHTD